MIGGAGRYGLFSTALGADARFMIFGYMDINSWLNKQLLDLFLKSEIWTVRTISSK